MNDFPQLYADVPAIGELSADGAERVLRELDPERSQPTLSRGQPAGVVAFLFGKRPYDYTNQTIGFIESADTTGENHIPIHSLGERDGR